MPRVEEIHAFLEEIAPRALAEDWDNVGTLVDCGREVSGVMTALDITGTTIAEAAEAGCELIVSHHPVIFHPLRRVDCTDPAYQLIRRQISGICMHTNLDTAAGGVNDQLAALFGLGEVRALEQMGRVGRLPAPMDPASFALLCKEKLGASGVQLADAGQPIRTLAVLGGAGGDFAAAAKAAGADCLLTGEAGHHDALDALRIGLSLVAAGHFSTEHPVVPYLADQLRRRFPALRVLVSQREQEPFTTL